MKASKTNGKKPALYEEYWILEKKKETDYRAYEDELNYTMSTSISVDYYLRHLEQYAIDREWVLMLNAYFMHDKGMLRSFRKTNAAFKYGDVRNSCSWSREGRS